MKQTEPSERLPAETGEKGHKATRPCSATLRTTQRVAYLSDPKTLDTLLDAFQADGMPMGSDRWAEYCHERLLELKEKERTLNKMMAAKREMDSAEKCCGSRIHRNHRQHMTIEFQESERQKELESIEEYEKETGKKFY